MTDGACSTPTILGNGQGKQELFFSCLFNIETKKRKKTVQADNSMTSKQANAEYDDENNSCV
jgi:hypothetical protein